jgi:hypothetical protein
MWITITAQEKHVGYYVSPAIYEYDLSRMDRNLVDSIGLLMNRI